MFPVFEPVIEQDDIDSVVGAMRRGEISGSFGKAIPEFEEKFAAYCRCKFGIAVSSGTTALHLAIASLHLNEGDEVLVSASTNIASALAIYHNNLIPVPIDSEPETWNLDINLLEKLITPRTKAIIPVHLFGHPVDMDALNEIALKYKLYVIEDAAEAHGAEVRGRKVGRFGDMACFSFYANKVITTGEGGMIVTNDESLAEELRLLRNLAFTSPRFQHQKAGYNFRMTGYQAAMGLSQFNKIDFFIENKRRIAKQYNQYLNSVPGICTPAEKEWAKNIYWMYAITIDEKKFGVSRNQLMVHLLKEGIDTRTFFCPMNIQPCFEHIPKTFEIKCPVAERIWHEGLYLPSSINLSETDITYICDKIKTVIS